MKPNQFFLPYLSSYEFLILYIISSIVILIIIDIIKKNIQKVEELCEACELSNLEISYLSGVQALRAVTNVIDIALFSLYLKKYIEISGDKIQKKGPSVEGIGGTSDFERIEKVVYNAIYKPVTLSQLRLNLHDSIKRQTEPLRESLEKKGFILPAEKVLQQKLVAWSGAVLVFGAGIARIIGDVIAGRPFADLIFYMIPYAVIYLSIANVVEVSSSGVKFLKDLQDRERENAKLIGTKEFSPDTMTLFVALFSFSILSGTVFEEFKTFAIPPSSGGECGGNCGGGCGGSCGGGCGGGCGG